MIDFVSSTVIHVVPLYSQWMEARPNSATCPVCKAVIDKDKVIPLYGRGSENKDPRENVPPRPQGQREEAAEEEVRMRTLLLSLSLSLSLSLPPSFSLPSNHSSLALIHLSILSYTGWIWKHGRRCQCFIWHGISLLWASVPDGEFPHAATRSREKRKKVEQTGERRAAKTNSHLCHNRDTRHYFNHLRLT